MARPPKDTELEVAPSFVYVPVGQGGVSLMLHPSVGIDNLTTEQVTAILTGEITNWSEIDGPEQDITLFVRDEEDSATASLRDTFFGESEFSETAIILTSASNMRVNVEATEYSIGFGGWPATLASGADIATVSLDGIDPADASYPMVTELGIGYLEEKADVAKVLVDWLVSDAGQNALANFGVILE